MDVISLVLIGLGLVAIVAGAWQLRGPLATIRQLDATKANLDRYESWRGKRSGVQADGPTGADIMRAQMRQRVILWSALVVVGVVAVLVGLAVR
jgi:hypothetical protein